MLVITNFQSPVKKGLSSTWYLLRYILNTLTVDSVFHYVPLARNGQKPVRTRVLGLCSVFHFFRKLSSIRDNFSRVRVEQRHNMASRPVGRGVSCSVSCSILLEQRNIWILSRCPARDVRTHSFIIHPCNCAVNTLLGAASFFSFSNGLLVIVQPLVGFGEIYIFRGSRIVAV